MPRYGLIDNLGYITNIIMADSAEDALKVGKFGFSAEAAVLMPDHIGFAAKWDGEKLIELPREIKESTEVN